MVGGGRSSSNGRIAEDLVESLEFLNFEVLRHKDYDSGILQFSDRLLVKRWPYTTVFGTTGYREFYISSREWSGHVECKHQNVSGSCDEKMVYVYHSLIECDFQNLLLLYSGEYWKGERGQKVIAYLKSRSLPNKQFLVMSHQEFRGWAMKKWR